MFLVVLIPTLKECLRLKGLGCKTNWSTEYLQSVFFCSSRFNFANNNWTVMKPMNTPRYRCTHVALLDSLYVFGGMDAQKSLLNSVERYEPLSNKWKTVAPMPHARYGPGTCALNGFIFVFGGWHREGVLRSIERYDILNNSWIVVIYLL